MVTIQLHERYINVAYGNVCFILSKGSMRIAWEIVQRYLVCINIFLQHTLGTLTLYQVNIRLSQQLSAVCSERYNSKRAEESC